MTEEELDQEIAPGPKPMLRGVDHRSEVAYAVDRFIESDEQAEEYGVAAVDLGAVVTRHPECGEAVAAIVALVTDLEELDET